VNQLTQRIKHLAQVIARIAAAHPHSPHREQFGLRKQLGDLHQSSLGLSLSHKHKTGSDAVLQSNI
jgi:hypothetical protein